MTTAEYVAFVPLLLYGIGISILMAEWKRLLNYKEVFLPYSIFTVALTETALYNVYLYIQIVDQIQGITYFSYLGMLLPPFLFLIATHAFTPEPGVATREYFIKAMPVFFTLMALFVGSHFFYTLDEPTMFHIIRAIAVAVLIAIGFTRKIWIVYVLGVLWFISFLVKIGVV